MVKENKTQPKSKKVEKPPKIATPPDAVVTQTMPGKPAPKPA